MINATVIIGANYGDEGKGLATDFFASQNSNSVVIRFNGGAQAGHTVVTPEGQRHVFHHFGAGSFCEIPTYLSQFFIVNPLLWKKELEELHALNLKPKMFLDYLSPVTTPYDMLLNRLIEDSRGKNAHGSVGVGVFETLNRELNGFSLRIEDLFDDSYVAIALDEIRNRYIPKRLQDGGLDPDSAKNWNVGKINQDFIQAMREMLKTHDVALDISEFQKQYMIFEGAQGLGLDPVFGSFPYVTPSRCGLNNIFLIFEKAFGELSKTINLDVYYMSRTYVTRHGNGPLMYESEKLASKLTDITNVENKYQGKFRYAELNEFHLRAMTNRLKLDVASIADVIVTSPFDYKLKIHVFFTHHDEIPLHKDLIFDKVPYVSSGPTRADVKSGNSILV